MTDMKRTANKVRAKLKRISIELMTDMERTANKFRAKLKGEYRVDD